MLELFVFGSLGFWSLILFVFCAMFYFAENEQGWLATLTIIGVAALLQFCGDIPVFYYCYKNPINVCLGILAYFAIGTVWAVAKWWFFVHDNLYYYNEAKREFFRNKNLDLLESSPVPADLQQDWVRFIGSWYYPTATGHGAVEINPSPGDHKMAIYTWIAVWFWSMIWTLLNDPIRKLCRAIYNRIAGFLQSISDSVWAGTKDDFNSIKKAKNG